MAKIPPGEYDSWYSYLSSILPGLILCFSLGAMARWIDQNLIPEALFMVNYVILAIGSGLVVKNLLRLGPRFEPGIAFSAKICLFAGIVLLGAGMDLTRVFSVGSQAVIMVAISITLAIVFCGWMARHLGGSTRGGHLIGVGIGVCGVSAIMATAPAIRARDKEVVTAIGAALLTDVLVLILLPLIGHPLGWSPTLAGFIAGIVPSNTAQCIAIGYAYCPETGAIATIVKSARNALLPIVVLVITYLYTRQGLPVGEKVSLSLLWNKFPKFILGFLGAAFLTTMGLVSPEGMALARDLSTWFFVTCFVGIGAGIELKELGKHDLAVIGLGFVTTFLLWLYVYLFVAFFF